MKTKLYAFYFLLISIVLLLSCGNLGQFYILTDEFSTAGQAIEKAKSMRNVNRLNTFVFEAPAKNNYWVVVGTYTIQSGAEREMNSFITSRVIPASSRVVKLDSSYRLLFPFDPKSPPGSEPNANPNQPQPAKKPEVRESVKKDVDEGMEDDFKVYPEN